MKHEINMKSDKKSSDSNNAYKCNSEGSSNTIMYSYSKTANKNNVSNRGGKDLFLLIVFALFI